MPRSYASTVIDAPADDVWSFVRDFGNLAQWLPGISTCAIEDGGPADRPGCVRRLIGPGDSVFRERLTRIDDAEHRCAYDHLEGGPLPVRDCHTTLRVAPVTGTGQSFVEWWADFDADADDREAMTKTFSEALFGPGLETLRRRFAG
jgi:hypothetical protein